MKQLSIFSPQEALQFPENLLEYYPGFVPAAESAGWMQKWVTEVPWRQQSMQMYGKEVIAPRLMAWFGETDKAYTFSGPRAIRVDGRIEKPETTDRAADRIYIQQRAVELLPQW
jgi:alkylated DNA repair dioxygenase AlkB